MLGQYILSDDGNTPVPCNDIMQWGKFLQSPERIVKQEALPDGRFLSTVFLGLDHSCFGDYGPILWESMLFEPRNEKGRLGKDVDQDRCGGDRSNALEMHARMLAKHSST